MGRVAAVVLATTILLPSAAACASKGSKAPTVPVADTSQATPEKLTPDVARQAYESYINDEDVARASGDERLALSLTSDGQSLLTASEFRKAVFTGDPVARYAYAAPKIYVPRLNNYPQWFVVSVNRVPTGQKAAESVWMGFVRSSPAVHWKLSLLTTRVAAAGPTGPGASSSPSPTVSPSSSPSPSPASSPSSSPSSSASPKTSAAKSSGAQVLVDSEGYAKALATYDQSLLIQPKSVPAIQATLAEEGADNKLAAGVMQTGTYTSDYYTQSQAAKKRAGETGLAMDTVFTATSYPIFPLATADGGGLILYALTRNAVTYVKKKGGRLPAPARDVAPLLDTLVLKDQLQVWTTLQFATYVPAAVKTKGVAQSKADVIGADGGVTNAITQTTS